MKNLFLFFLCSIISIGLFGQIKENQSIDSIFIEWSGPDAPGCALGIFQEGKIMYSKGFGLANMEYDIPNSTSSVFRIGSTSKQFTAACIVLLAEQGKLSLEDNLKSFFPDFPDYAEKITISHLLNHTSGIRDYLRLAYLKGLVDDDFYTDGDIMEWLINQSDLNFEPGEEHLYSNSGYWLLGQIVNKVSEMNMVEFAQKEIFEPLGMKNTHFHNDHTQIVKNRASGYAPNDSGGYKISMTTLDMIGDGGIFTSINDIKKWDDAYYSSGILSKEFWAMMTQQGILNNGDTIDYASGLMISEYKGLKTIRHGGAFVGFRAELLRFPEHHLSIAIFANRADANPSGKANQVADVLLKGKLIEEDKRKDEKTSNEVPAVDFQLNQLVGNYELQPGVVVSLSIKNDSLNVLQTWNKQSYNIVRTNVNTYQIPGEKDLIFTFSNLKDGYTQTLTAMQGSRETVATRKNNADTSGVNLNDYTGSYYSHELEVIYNFELENEVLMVGIGKRKFMECSISDKDQFITEAGLVGFQRTDGNISGFVLNSGRVKNLKFEKE